MTQQHSETQAIQDQVAETQRNSDHLRCGDTGAGGNRVVTRETGWLILLMQRPAHTTSSLFVNFSPC